MQYVTGVLSQIFLYCWYGCKIDEKVHIEFETIIYKLENLDEKIGGLSGHLSSLNYNTSNTKSTNIIYQN